MICFSLSGYSAQAVYHVEIAENIVRNQGSLADEYSTDQPLIYSTLVEMYFILGRALTTEKKYLLLEACDFFLPLIILSI